MTILRVIVVDPSPREGAVNDILVYQVPERSRAAELLYELLDGAGIEHVTIEPRKRKRTYTRKVAPANPSMEQGE